MEQRTLGKTGAKLSVIGFGGILCTDTTPQESAKLVSEAIDLGVNYFDVAPSYGNAEERLGPALEPYRDKVFLACKTGKRDKAGAAAELRASLGRLKTDHVDLYQMHSLTSDDDVARAFGPDGALEAFVEARQAGLVRHLGFSAHSHKAALAAMARFDFDSILFPTNYLIATLGGFGPPVFAEAHRRGLGHLALKTLGLRQMTNGEVKRWTKCWYQPLDDPELVGISLRWTLSQGVTAGPTPGHPELFRLAVAAAANLSLPSDEELGRLRAALGEHTPVFKA
jgi:aryl-alcohol dehydrogenase-like predicted oxidoreductase